MSMGSKKSNSSKVKINAPPAITQTDYSLPTGDRFVSRSSGGTEYFENFLSPQSQAVVNETSRGLQDLARELRSPDAARTEQIKQRGRDFYDLQARGINEVYDDRLKQTQSDLNKRFGGAYNATFGTDLLARLEKERGNTLANADKEANLLSEELSRSDEESKAQRFALFQGYLADLSNQAMGISSVGSQTLAADRARQTQLAVQRAQLAQRALEQEEQMRQQRLNTLGGGISGAASVLGGLIPGPAGIALGAAGAIGQGFFR